MMRRVSLGDREICYELTRKKVKNINLRIHLDGRITVSAGSKVPETVINQFIIKKSPFILNALERFSERRNAEINNGSGDEIFLFGEPLKIRRAVGNKRRTSLLGNELWVYIRDGDGPDVVNESIENFMRSELKTKLDELVPRLWERFTGELRVEPSGIKIRKMKSRWGSCNCKSGDITFNLYLAKYPLICLEFVIVHELCHLFHPNHSKDFYALLTSVMPDWKERKLILNKK